MQHDSKAVSTSLWDKLNQRAQSQDWPDSALYVVATPIGNMLDLSIRAWHTFMRCNVVAAEDTRTTKALFNAWGIERKLIAAHRHNEIEAANTIIKKLSEGNRVALVSDAGAPAISDPGGRLVAMVLEAGYRVIPVPGPSAVLSALMASGVTSDANPEFAFAGFVPSKTGARSEWLQRWCNYGFVVAMYESPHRIKNTLQALAEIMPAQRLITVARELTKKFEQIVTIKATDINSWLTENEKKLQGEFVLIIHSWATESNSSEIGLQSKDLIKALVQEVSVRDAARVVARLGIMPRDQAYKLALEVKSGF